MQTVRKFSLNTLRFDRLSIHSLSNAVTGLSRKFQNWSFTFKTSIEVLREFSQTFILPLCETVLWTVCNTLCVYTLFQKLGFRPNFAIESRWLLLWWPHGFMKGLHREMPTRISSARLSVELAIDAQRITITHVIWSRQLQMMIKMKMETWTSSLEATLAANRKENCRMEEERETHREGKAKRRKGREKETQWEGESENRL